jgi:hypothetical protein
MNHTHHHESHESDLSDSRLLLAIVLNLALTLVEIVGGERRFAQGHSGHPDGKRAFRPRY